MLRKIIQNEMNKREITHSMLAKEIGVTSSVISKFINNTQETSFEIVLATIRFLFSNKEDELMIKYIQEINKPSNIYPSLEYLATHRHIEELGILIEKQASNKNATCQEWLKIYSFFYNWQKNFKNIPRIEQLKRIRELKAQEPELKIFIRLMEMYVFYFELKYCVVQEFSTGLYEEIKALENNYIKSSYKARFSEMMSYINLKVYNDQIKARDYAESLLEGNIGRCFNGFAYFIKGYSYLYESFDKTVKYLKESYKQYHKYYNAYALDIDEKIELAKVIWDKPVEPKYPLNQAYLLIKQGNNDQAITILEGIESEEKEPLVQFLRGLIYKDSNIMLQSMICLLKRGDTFLANMPKVALLQNGFSEDVLTDLINLHIK